MTSRVRDIVTIGALALIFVGAGIGLKDPWPSDEPRFALIAKEMVDTGQWFFPRRGGELYPDKPPMYMWSQAVFYKLTGSIRVSHALPSLLASLLTLALVYSAGRRLWDRQTAVLACLLLLGAPQFVIESRAGQIDAMVTAWIALGVYGFLRHLLLGPSVGWLMVGFAASGFGIITKGVGFLPVLMFLPVLLVMKQLAAPVAGKAALRGLGGILVMLLACSTWFIPMVMMVASSGDPALEAYRDNILFKQTGQRYATPEHHFQPFWYFLTNVIPALWLPVFLLLPWLVRGWWKDLRERDPRIVLLVGWAALVILFFSMSPGKRGVYILPALPWVCLAAAPVLKQILDRRSLHLTSLVTAVVLAALLVLGWVFLQFIDPERALAITDRYEVDPRGVLLVGAILASAATIIWHRNGPKTYLAVMGSLWLTYGLWVYPHLDNLKSGRSLMLRVEEALPDNAPLALVNWKEQTLLQARRPTVNFGFLVPREEQARSAIAWLERQPEGFILLQEPDLIDCFYREKSLYMGLAHRRHWYLVNREDVSDACA